MGVTNFNQVEVDAGGLIVGGVQVTAISPQGTDGLSARGILRVTFDAGDVANQAQGDHVTAVGLPDNSVVVGGFFDVNTVFHSDGADAGTIEVTLNAAGDLVTAAAVGGAPFSTIGRKAIKPKANTPESTSIKTTGGVTAVTFTVAGQDLTAGKLTLFLDYVISVLSA